MAIYLLKHLCIYAIPALVIAPACFSGCSPDPQKNRGSVEMIHNGSRTDMKISWRLDRKTTGVSDIYVWDITNNNLLWVVDCNRQIIQELTYGALPAGCVQVFPSSGSPESLPEGDSEIGIEVNYLFDNAWPPAASIDSLYFQVSVTESGVEIDQAPFLNRPPYERERE